MQAYQMLVFKCFSSFFLLGSDAMINLRTNVVVSFYIRRSMWCCLIFALTIPYLFIIYFLIFKSQDVQFFGWSMTFMFKYFNHFSVALLDLDTLLRKTQNWIMISIVMKNGKRYCLIYQKTLVHNVAVIDELT